MCLSIKRREWGGSMFQLKVSGLGAIVCQCEGKGGPSSL